MAARYGYSELLGFSEGLLHKNNILSKIRPEQFRGVCFNGGLFPKTDEIFSKFTDEMIRATQVCDLMCVWYNLLEEYACKKFLPKDSYLTHLEVFDFWQFNIPFTSALKEKKVLVIHPFAKTIQSQYKKRELLFENPNVLPEFELKTIKAVQTIAGQRDERFSDWFEALEHMYNEAMKIDFDVAILGCGAYGFPLAAKLKRAGKIAIHMGGVTQMLFGIKGGRWDVHPEASKLYNEHWVRPNSEEVPEKAKDIEGGCYW